MMRPADLIHDYLLPNGLVRVCLTTEERRGDHVYVTVAYTLGRTPVCIVACSPARLSSARDQDADSLVDRIIDKTHNLLRIAPNGPHVDALKDVIREWIFMHGRIRQNYLSAA